MGIALLVILGVVVLGVGGAFLAFEPGRREALNLQIAEVPFDGLRDGSYSGEYVGTRDHLRDTKVQVTVQSGRVTKIDVTGGALAGEKQTAQMRGGQSILNLFDRVIAEQSLQVDAISGATITCKTHLKAVESALEQAKK